MSEQAADRPVSGTPDPGASHADDDAGRMAGADAPAAPNQQKTEPIPPSGAGDRAAGAETNGVPVPSEVPAEGTSEGAAPVEGVTQPAEGVTQPAVAPEGLADGEPDVAMPSTTHF